MELLKKCRLPESIVIINLVIRFISMRNNCATSKVCRFISAFFLVFDLLSTLELSIIVVVVIHQHNSPHSVERHHPSIHPFIHPSSQHISPDHLQVGGRLSFAVIAVLSSKSRPVNFLCYMDGTHAETGERHKMLPIKIEYPPVPEIYEIT